MGYSVKMYLIKQNNCFKSSVKYIIMFDVLYDWSGLIYMFICVTCYLFCYVFLFRIKVHKSSDPFCYMWHPMRGEEEGGGSAWVWIDRRRNKSNLWTWHLFQPVSWPTNSFMPVITSKHSQLSSGTVLLMVGWTAFSGVVK